MPSSNLYYEVGEVHTCWVEQDPGEEDSEYLAMYFNCQDWEYMANQDFCVTLADPERSAEDANADGAIAQIVVTAMGSIFVTVAATILCCACAKKRKN